MANSEYQIHDVAAQERRRILLVDNGDGTFSHAAAVSIDPGDISIGAVELKDADSSDRAKLQAANAGPSASDIVLLVQPVDETGAVISGGGAAEANYAAPFNVNDMEDGATYLYVGLSDELGSWYVKRVPQDGTGVAHATMANNVSVTTYPDAWSARATLTYQRFDQAF